MCYYFYVYYLVMQMLYGRQRDRRIDCSMYENKEVNCSECPFAKYAMPHILGKWEKLRRARHD